MNTRRKLFESTTDDEKTAFVRGFVDAEGVVHKTLYRNRFGRKIPKCFA
ncbi:MAG: hypothetical protein QXF45_01140 [Candidatus Caldarchaeum sp.]